MLKAQHIKIHTPKHSSDREHGSSEKLDLDWVPGLEEMQEKPSAYKVRNLYSHSKNFIFPNTE